MWDPQEQMLYWVDIEAKELHHFDPATGKDGLWSMPSRIGCFAIRSRGGFIVALEDGFHLFDPVSGNLEHLHDPEPDRPGNRLNDGTTDPLGRMIATTMPMGPREPVGSVYKLRRDGRVERLFHSLKVPNGCAFSPDGRTFYFSDTASDVQTIWACDYNPEDGHVSNRRTFAETHELAGRPDGGTIDAAGCYWMAGMGGWQLVRFTPAGKVDRIIEMPCERPSKIAFGGRDLDILYVTSAADGLSEGTEARQPHAGGIFALRVPGAVGLPTPRFHG